ncbi:MAG: hypothetical protein IJ729_08285 [Alloprevotella sp.]|nr:hypothetical protein [Alloprevotella sp.]
MDDAADRREFSTVYEHSSLTSSVSRASCGIPRRAIIIFSGRGNLWAFDKHGGWADRLKGILSVYKAAKLTGRDFRILHTYRFNLDEYLAPALHDWRIEPEEVSYDTASCTPYYFRHSHYPDERAYSAWRLLRKLGGEEPCLHLYSNVCAIADEEFPALFRELFSPSPVLGKALAAVGEALGHRFISLSFRFTHLLGDPVDTYMKELEADEKERLVATCVETLAHFHAEFPSHRLLVNSDSATFLAKVRSLSCDYLYVIPGTPVHIDQVASTEADQLKTFVDFMAISKAERVFQIIAPGMRNSGFPQCAALIGGKPYEVRYISYAQ